MDDVEKFDLGERRGRMYGVSVVKRYPTLYLSHACR